MNDSTIQALRGELASLAQRRGLLAEQVAVRIKPLGVKQAIGTPERDDFPLQKGKERIIEASFKGGVGQAFTDAFRDFESDMAGLLALDLTDPFNAAAFVAAANAIAAHLGLARQTIHCRDKEPTLCAPKLVEYLRQRHPGARRVTLVGLQPAMAAALAPHYELAILDMDPDNIGRTVAGATVGHGGRDLERLAAWADVLAVTGSTLANNSIEAVRAAAGPRPVIFFGVTIAGAAELLGLERFCPLGH